MFRFLIAVIELVTGGRLIITFRDLCYELSDEKRFILVRNDNNTIFNCYLEYFTDYVKVFDIIHTKENEAWKPKISYYRKLRISAVSVKELFEKTGFNIEYDLEKKGFVSIIGRK